MLHIPAIMALAGFLLAAQSEPEKALRRAVQLQQDGDLKGAIEEYLALLARNPDLAEVRVKLGNAYASGGRYQDAVSPVRTGSRIRRSRKPGRRQVRPRVGPFSKGRL